MKNIVVPCELNPLPVREVEIDEFDVRYTANEKMNIQNDTITLNYRLSGKVPFPASMQQPRYPYADAASYHELVLHEIAG